MRAQLGLPLRRLISARVGGSVDFQSDRAAQFRISSAAGGSPLARICRRLQAVGRPANIDRQRCNAGDVGLGAAVQAAPGIRVPSGPLPQSYSRSEMISHLPHQLVGSSVFHRPALRAAVLRGPQ